MAKKGEKLYCCFMVPMKFNSGLGGTLKNDSIFKTWGESTRGEKDELGQAINFYIH